MPRNSDPNHCAADEIEDLWTPPPVQASRKRKGASSDEVVNGGTEVADAGVDDGGSAESRRGAAQKIRLEIFQRMQAWHIGGSRLADSPIDELVKKFKCNTKYPSKVFRKMSKTGTCGDRRAANLGRPRKLGTAAVEHMDQVRRARREEKLPAPTRLLSASLKRKGIADVSQMTVVRQRQRQGVKRIKVKIKPKLNFAGMARRLQQAMDNLDRNWDRTVVIDQKWHSEEKGTNKCIDACPDSPVRPGLIYEGKQAETQTQRVKLMYVAAATGSKKILLEEWDFKAYHDAERKKHPSHKGKGVDTAFLIHNKFWKRLHAAARRELGPGPIHLWMDQAGAHKSKETQAIVKGLFDEVVLQEGKSPEMNLMDAGVFPWMERVVYRLLDS